MDIDLWLGVLARACSMDIDLWSGYEQGLAPWI